jgi:hypothetical protein
MDMTDKERQILSSILDRLLKEGIDDLQDEVEVLLPRNSSDCQVSKPDRHEVPVSINKYT